MKVFKKVFAFAIALTAIAMASSAMAAEQTATYTAHKIAVPVASESTEQATIAVVDADFGESDATTTAADIYYINQDEAKNIANELTAGVGLKSVENFVPTSVEVRLGGAMSGEYTVFPFTFDKEAVVPAEPIAGIKEGTERIGFEGEIVVNGGTFSDILFTLSSEGDAELGDKTITVRASEAAWKNAFTIPSVYGTVTFGLEIEGVPTGVTVTLENASVIAE